MKIDIYRSATNSGKYLSVPADTDVTKVSFPADLDKDLHKLSPFKTQLELVSDRPSLTLDRDEVISQINSRGYATHGAKILIGLNVK